MKRGKINRKKSNRSKIDIIIDRDYCLLNGIEDLNEAIDKLGNLEDLEEQIGMTLDVAIQILMNGIVYVMEEKRYCKVLSFVNKTIKDGVTVFTYRSRANFETRLYSDSYGVKWFLNQEEAEEALEAMKNGK